MNVFLVEDSAPMRERLRSMLSEIPGIVLTGHAEDEAGAIQCIGEATADLVILDLSLKSGSGIEVLKYLKQRHAEVRVMVLTNHTDEMYVSRCMNAGADYFFDKSFQFMEVGAVIKQLAFGGGLDSQLVALP